MALERKGPAELEIFDVQARRTGMKKTVGIVQELRAKMYEKAKAEPTWRFWGLYGHVCKAETLREGYALARKRNGAPGIDGVSFEAIEEAGVEEFLEQIRSELVSRGYKPLLNRKKEISKGGGKMRTLSIPSIRDRVVQGALKLILEPIFEADFQDGSYGYRPKRKQHDAIDRVSRAIGQQKTRVIDIDLRAFFDNVRHHIVFEKVARRVQDPEVMHLLKLMLKASGKKGVPQGGVISPLLSNIYLNEVDRMLERAKEVTRDGKYVRVEYARYADDLVILVDGHKRHEELLRKVEQRLREELGKLQVEVNEEKSRTVDLGKGESFTFLGMVFRRLPNPKTGKWWVNITPSQKRRKQLLSELKQVFRSHVSQPIIRVIEKINPMLRGWVNYFAFGHASRSFSFIRDWVEKKIRRHLNRARGRHGFSWKGWSRDWLYNELGLFSDYRVRWKPRSTVLPT